MAGIVLDLITKALGVRTERPVALDPALIHALVRLVRVQVGMEHGLTSLRRAAVPDEPVCAKAEALRELVRDSLCLIRRCRPVTGGLNILQAATLGVRGSVHLELDPVKVVLCAHDESLYIYLAALQSDSDNRRSKRAHDCTCGTVVLVGIHHETTLP